MKNLFLLLYILSFSVSGQVSMDYYLPKNVSYDPDIPTPQEVLGYVPGEWHVSHDQLLYYMRALAEASNRIIIEEYAKSYEGRQLVQLIITSPENQQSLAEIKASRLEVKKGGDVESPLVVQLGYSVHGNEASGSNASLLTAYYLAAAKGNKIDKMLDQTVIIVDPSYNPDGLNRFASWVNTHKSKNITSDPNHREYHEVWPRGRTNHYWFDLNRDWLPVQHPESQGRIRQFHVWMPHILTDHHEMGTSGTFFFQPGIPSRKFPNTDPRNPEITNEIGRFHAKALDSIGSLYYSKESFDDFYIGKGSTYPDINGSIGILFEQASARGHAQDGPYGVLTFPFAIRNHFVSSISTLTASQNMMNELKAYQLQQYRDASKWNSPKAYVFGDSRDPMKSLELVKILKNHDIMVNEVARNITVQGKSFQPRSSYIVTMDQPQARLIKSIFEIRTSFNDSLFYDVSAWTLPLAMNISYGEIKGKAFDPSYIGKEATTAFNGDAKRVMSTIGYAFETNGYYSHRAIQRLLDADIILRVTHDSFASDEKTFDRGTIVIPILMQRERFVEIQNLVELIAREDGVVAHPLFTGFSDKGIDMGSPSMSLLKKLKIAILVEGGVSSYEAGEAWHVLDQRVDASVTLLPVSRVNSVDLFKYNRIVLPNGTYGDIRDEGVNALKKWIESGGVIVAWKEAGSWLANKKLSKAQYVSNKKDTVGFKPYADYSKNRGARVTGGAIFNAKVDLTHPLAYGLLSDEIPLFRNHNRVLKKSENPYSQPLIYEEDPLLSGYVHPDNLKRFRNSPAVLITAMGSGRVIVFSDNPNFRAFWYGTNKLFFNALYFGHTIKFGSAQ